MAPSRPCETVTLACSYGSEETGHGLKLALGFWSRVSMVELELDDVRVAAARTRGEADHAA